MAVTQPIRRALLSVSDKTGIIELAQALQAANIKILSTGGTAKLLMEANIDVKEVSSHTGFPEMMDGRIKTLHPKIHGGLLGRRGQDDDVMATHGIQPIDLLVVNLYPFESTVANPDCTLPDAIENIDIGGPAMLRAASKNFQDVAVVVDTQDYDRVIQQVQNSGGIDEITRFEFSVKAFSHTAAYDGAIANYLGRKLLHTQGNNEKFPGTWSAQFNKVQNLRYGENPHQQAAFYIDPKASEASVATAKQIQGKELSFNNIADTDAALECVKSFAEPACVIVKHANPCGVAIADNITKAYELAFQTDPTSAFGGIIAFNRELDKNTAQTIVDKQFIEVIIAPTIQDGVAGIIASKKNIRLLVCGELPEQAKATFDYKKVNGGLLIQDLDQGQVTQDELKVVSKRQPSEQEIQDALFAWNVAKFVKSNAIVYCKNGQTIGVGAGQMSRVYSAKIAGIKAADENLEVQGSVMASDAFFPFRDGIDAAAEAGITTVIQPGGSMRDEEVIAAADEANMAMIFTGMRHFKH